MKLIGLKQLVTLGLAFTLVACQSAPKSDVDLEPAEDLSVDASADVSTSLDRSTDDAASLASKKTSKLLAERVFYFDFDLAKIHSSAFDTLNAHASYLASNPDAQLRLEGHADERGTREYNVALGERRANAVVKFLRLNGVPGSQMEAVSYGEEKPAVFGQSEAAWAKNRRVELIYVAGAPK